MYKNTINLWLLLSMMIVISCKTNSSNQDPQLIIDDPHSFSNPNEAIVKHFDLELEVDFSNQQLQGVATWTIETKSDADTIIFDTKQMQVHSVSVDGKETTFSLGKEVEHLGQPLYIPIQPGSSKVSIKYTTSKDAGALQWLTPQQTAGKKKPFLFTQSQPILARSWVPTQDGPAIRFTYNATVKVPPGLVALMSSENPQEKSPDGVYNFKQPHPIPSYLMALAVGDLEFKAVDNRTGVYAEPTIIDTAAWEFADMGKMIEAAEELYGPYRWGRYDVLVLPPSFPYGGMENPILTFATPTIIAGDRSLVSLIAHELAHSWSGNLVTNATWDDMWLNEGFTTYFERRIIEAVYGKEEAKMQEVLGRQALYDDIAEIGDTSADTRLKTDFTGRNPDGVSSDVPYEKGYFFLRTIEEAVGRNNFDAFLKKYFDEYAFQSRTTEQFIDYLKEYFPEDKLDKVKINQWIYKTGIPDNIPSSVSPVFEVIDSISAKAVVNNSFGGLSNFINSTNELLYFISSLPDTLNPSDMSAIDREFDFTNSGNAEIQAAWYTLAIRNKYIFAYPAIDDFLVSVGRRKFLLPLYKEMIKTPEGKEMAKSIYAKARGNYHPVSYTSIDDLIK